MELLRGFSIYVTKIAASFHKVLVLIEWSQEKNFVAHERFEDLVEVLGFSVFYGFGVYHYNSVFI